ncbi:NAD-P-binding protein [Trametes coccinea BRFM310]|uniref:NAD-P-binding protein n=1 Tax=Trametes coccinea (strain BRFM310) TaxID=1353009 RepID=A0A1Y2ICQ4_TRAC3|nr:NAD-P-binding protein [Trametes coccinea BRFM310]
MSSPKVWFITGTSSGFGRALAEYVLAKGDIVVATARRPAALDDLKAQYPSDRLLVIKLNVDNPQEVVDAFAQVKSKIGRLDVVFNNAAYGTFGELETVRDEDVRAEFDTNFWGAFYVSREAVKFFREVNAPGVGGRLLQVSSMTGVAGAPGLGFYAASKFALEGLSECLASELDPAWNIKVTLVQPGSYRTPGFGKVIWSPPHPAYSNPDLPATKLRAIWNSVNSSGDPAKAAKAFYEIGNMANPPLHVPVGKDSSAVIRKKLADLTAEVDKYEYLSQDLEFDQ